MELVTKQKVEALFSPALTGKTTYTADEILLTLQTMPTVEAIPVEWAILYDANLCRSPYCFEDDDRSDIERMVDDWRKENGSNR